MNYNIDLIEEYRKKNNLSKLKLAKKCGINIEKLRKIYKKEAVDFDDIRSLIYGTHIRFYDFFFQKRENKSIGLVEFLCGVEDFPQEKIHFNIHLIDLFLEKNNISKNKLCNLCNFSSSVLERIYNNDLGVGFFAIK